MLIWLVYAVVGKIVIFIWQKFPLEKITILQPLEILQDLHKCDLCSGVWIYSALAVAFKIGILAIFQLQTNQIIDQIITGCITSFVVWIFAKGWHAAFTPDIIHL